MTGLSPLEGLVSIGESGIINDCGEVTFGGAKSLKGARRVGTQVSLRETHGWPQIPSLTEDAENTASRVEVARKLTSTVFQ